MSLRVCIVRHRDYPGDARIETQVQALLEADNEVDLVCMRRSGESFRGSEHGVRLYRLLSLERQRQGMLRYVAEYLVFLTMSFLLLAVLQVRHRYALIHVCNLPDFLVFAALIPKILGAKVVLDLRESTPEFFHVKFGAPMDGLLMRAVIAVEQLSIKFADAALTCTEQMRLAFVSRGADPGKISVMLNSPNPEFIRDPALPNPAAQSNGTFRIVTHGTITERYGHDVLIRAMPLVLDKVPGARLEIFGAGSWRAYLEDLIESCGVGQAVSFAGYVPLDDLINRLQRADCGIVPMPRNPETDLIHTHKMQEYMVLGVPVIISRTTSVEYYFDDTCVRFFESGDERDLAQAIIDLYQNPQTRYHLARNALAVYEKYSAPAQRKHYAALVRDLIAGSRPRDVPAPVSGEAQ
jgi:glycosyltransferase involved in cell wall biosynthesis